MLSPAEIDLNNPWAGAKVGGGIFWWLLKTASVFTLFYLGTKEIRDKENNGFMSFGKGFGTTYKTALITLGVYVVVSAIYFYVVNPDWYPISWDQMAESLEESGQGGDLSKILDIMRMVYDHITEITLVSALITNAIAFAIVSLIIAGVLQKDDPEEIKL
jgi:hypothetical protein